MSVINVRKARKRSPLSSHAAAVAYAAAHLTEHTPMCCCGHAALAHQPTITHDAVCTIDGCGCMHYIRGYKCPVCKLIFIAESSRDECLQRCNDRIEEAARVRGI